MLACGLLDGSAEVSLAYTEEEEGRDLCDIYGSVS